MEHDRVIVSPIPALNELCEPVGHDSVAVTFTLNIVSLRIIKKSDGNRCKITRCGTQHKNRLTGPPIE